MYNIWPKYEIKIYDRQKYFKPVKLTKSMMEIIYMFYNF